VGDLAGIGKSGRVKLSRLLESNPRVITSAIVSELLSMPLKEARDGAEVDGYTG